MGNASGRESGGDESPGRSNGALDRRDGYVPNSNSPGRFASSDSMSRTPPESPGRSRSPVMFAPQLPVHPIQRVDAPPPSASQMWQNDSGVGYPPERGIPTMITWNYGGNDVAVEGSWDNWTSRRILQRSGKDHSILLVLPSGIYHYKFIVDGEWRYIEDLPRIADEMGSVSNVLDVYDHVPESLESVAEFETPQSPDSSYAQAFPTEEDFAKEPVTVPSQLHLTVIGMQDTDASPPSSSFAPPSNPQHVVLNHLFIERGCASKSVVAMGLTHRFKSKYVTVVLYKALNK